MTWVILTEILDKQEIPMTLVNMDNILRIQPMRNTGSLIHFINGTQIFVKDIVTNIIPKLEGNLSTVEKPTESVDLSNKIIEIMRGQVRSPNGEIGRRIRGIIKRTIENPNELNEEEITKPEEDDENASLQTRKPFFKKISNTTANLGLI